MVPADIKLQRNILMSFAILILIFFLLYSVLTKYGSIVKVVAMQAAVFGMTSLFMIYGIRMLADGNTFIILNTEIDRVSFIHVCIVWFIADMIVTYKIIRNYRHYKEVNSSANPISAQERE
jgi:hypothetical protein